MQDKIREMHDGQKGKIVMRRKENISIRIEPEIYDALQALAVKRNEGRVRAQAAQDARRAAGRPYRVEMPVPPVFTVSTLIRDAIKIALKIWSDDENDLRDYFGPIIDADVKRVLAAGIIDPEGGKLLRDAVVRLEGNEAQPDFG